MTTIVPRLDVKNELVSPTKGERPTLPTMTGVSRCLDSCLTLMTAIKSLPKHKTTTKLIAKFQPNKNCHAVPDRVLFPKTAAPAVPAPSKTSAGSQITRSLRPVVIGLPLTMFAKESRATRSSRVVLAQTAKKTRATEAPPDGSTRTAVTSQIAMQAVMMSIEESQRLNF